MKEFPDFMLNDSNLIDSGYQSKGVEGYVYDGADKSQLAYWTCHIDGESLEHVHEFDEYMVVISGSYTVIIDNQAFELINGDEYFIPKNTPHSGKFKAGTRTIHAFGGHRAKRKSLL